MSDLVAEAATAAVAGAMRRHFKSFVDVYEGVAADVVAAVRPLIEAEVRAQIAQIEGERDQAREAAEDNLYRARAAEYGAEDALRAREAEVREQIAGELQDYRIVADPMYHKPEAWYSALHAAIQIVRQEPLPPGM